MQSIIVTMLFCLVGMTFCILLVLAGIAKTVKNSSESLSKIAKYLDRITEKDDKNS